MESAAKPRGVYPVPYQTSPPAAAPLFARIAFELCEHRLAPKQQDPSNDRPQFSKFAVRCARQLAKAQVKKKIFPPREVRAPRRTCASNMKNPVQSARSRRPSHQSCAGPRRLVQMSRRGIFLARLRVS